MAHGNPDTETTAHAVLDATGRVMAADATFNMWLGGRTLAELLPTVELSVYDDRAVERVEVFRANQYPTTAQIEWIPLIGEFGSCQLLRIQIAELLTVEDGNYRDAVTGLPDRRALEAHRSTWKTTIGDDVPHALLFLDLDNFKLVNDQYGHPFGDKVLATLAERWRKSIRDNDLIIRYGGDEFVILLASVRTPAHSRPIVDRVKQVTSASIQLAGVEISISATIGWAVADEPSVPLERLIADADKALYGAKRQTS